MRRSKHFTQALKTQLKNIEIAKARIRALHFAVEGLQDHWNYEEGSQVDFSRLHSALYSKLNEAYHGLFMIGLFDPVAEQAARREAYEHFLRKDYEIMHFLNLCGRRSGVYSTHEEVAFREEFAEAKIRGELRDALRTAANKRKLARKEGKNDGG